MAKHVKVQDFASLYSDEERVMAFHWEISLSSNEQEEYVILEPCSKEETVNTPSMGGSLVPPLYLYISIIFYMGILIPFT